MPLSKLLFHSNTYLLKWNNPTIVYGVDILIPTYLLSHLFYLTKKLSLVALCLMNKKKPLILVYPRERRNMANNISHLSARFCLVMGWGCIGVGRSTRNWNFKLYLKSKRLHCSPQFKKQWIQMVFKHAWVAWNVCLGSSCHLLGPEPILLSM